ncbi:hypothetical protein D9M68_307070 [compost metagenome]
MAAKSGFRGHGPLLQKPREFQAERRRPESRWVSLRSTHPAQLLLYRGHEPLSGSADQNRWVSVATTVRSSPR